MALQRFTGSRNYLSAESAAFTQNQLHFRRAINSLRAMKYIAAVPDVPNGLPLHGAQNRRT